MCFPAHVNKTEDLYNEIGKNKTDTKIFYKIVTFNSRCSPLKSLSPLHYPKGAIVHGKTLRGNNTRCKKIRRDRQMTAGIYVYVKPHDAYLACNNSSKVMVIKVSAHKDDLIGAGKKWGNTGPMLACFRKVKVLD